MPQLESCIRYVYSTLTETPIKLKNCLVKNIEIITDPLSTSLPVSHIIGIVDHSLIMVNYFRKEVVLPHLVKSLAGVSEVIGVVTFINTCNRFIPCLTRNNLDKKALEASVKKFAGLAPDQKEKWAKRVVKQVKISLKNKHLTAAVRGEVTEMLIKKNLAPEVAQHLAGAIILQSEKTTVIEKVYNLFFFFFDVEEAVSVFERWEVINLGAISEKIGNSRLANFFSQSAGPKITRFVTKWSLNELALFAGVLGTSIKISHDSYELLRVHNKLKKSSLTLEKRTKSLEKRKDKIWSVAIDSLQLAGMVAPLLLSINPAVLISYELGVLTLSLVDALRK